MINLKEIQALTNEGRKSAILNRIAEVEERVKVRASAGDDCVYHFDTSFASEIIEYFMRAGFKARRVFNSLNMRDCIEISWKV